MIICFLLLYGATAIPLQRNKKVAGISDRNYNRGGSLDYGPTTTPSSNPGDDYSYDGITFWDDFDWDSAMAANYFVVYYDGNYSGGDYGDGWDYFDWAYYGKEGFGNGSNYGGDYDEYKNWDDIDWVEFFSDDYAEEYWAQYYSSYENFGKDTFLQTTPYPFYDETGAPVEYDNPFEGQFQINVYDPFADDYYFAEDNYYIEAPPSCSMDDYEVGDLVDGLDDDEAKDKKEKKKLKKRKKKKKKKKKKNKSKSEDEDENDNNKDKKKKNKKKKKKKKNKQNKNEQG